MLSKQILDEQIRLELPGLAKDCSEICQRLEIENIVRNEIPENKWKRKVKLASKAQAEVERKEEMKRLSKLENLRGETFEKKYYIKSKIIDDARTMFKIRTKMIDVKFNYQNNPKYSSELWMKFLTSI